MTEKDDTKIRDLLKKSPPLTPPESFYRGVLEKIEQKKGRASEGRESWSWGIPVKTLAMACVLMVIVLVTRETRKSNPELFEQKMESEKIAAIQNESRPAPRSFTQAMTPEPKQKKAATVMAAPKEDNAGSLQDLARSDEVQTRLNKNMAGYVGAPSPFAEEDARLRDKLQSASHDSPRGPAAQARKTVSSSDSGYLKEARDTVEGSASQGSFLQSPRALSVETKKRQEPERETPMPKSLAKSDVRARAALGYGGTMAAAPLGLAGKEKDKDNAQGWKGWASGIAEFRTIVVRSPAEWESLWREHSRNALPIPAVDFDRYMVVGIFAGAKPSAGYSVTLTEITTLPDQVVVSYEETPPPPGVVAAQALTQPYDLRAIPKTDQPISFKSKK